MKTKKATLIRYPWDTWFKQGLFTLKKGVDYKCAPHSMSVQIRTVASSRGVSVSVLIKGTVLSVTVNPKERLKKRKKSK